jgi:signal transduction histidine kinase
MAALGQLVAGVAHEVNNPLAFLKSNIELIKKNLQKIKEDDGEKSYNPKLLKQFKKQVDTSITGINRIATIIRTLKRFSKPDTDGWSISDINQGLKDTLVLVYNQLKHRIEVIEDYGKLPAIECNIGQLNQVFMNLILNSSQAMAKGKIWIKSWNDDKNIFIEIRDNGRGIPKDKINKIFDPFFTTKDMGTGLGLSICYRIIQDHGGEILVDSKEGKGTKITIKLPMEVRD